MKYELVPLGIRIYVYLNRTIISCFRTQQGIANTKAEESGVWKTFFFSKLSIMMRSLFVAYVFPKKSVKKTNSK